MKYLVSLIMVIASFVASAGLLQISKKHTALTIVYSSSDDKASFDDEKLRHGMFTGVLLNTIENNSHKSLSEILEKIAKNVEKTSHNRQSIYIETDAKQLSSPICTNGINYIFAIGINRFINTVKPLKYAKSDAISLSKVLTHACKNSEQTVLINDKASRQSINASLQSILKKVTRQDNIIVYYSGHGLMTNSKRYLLPYDAEKLEMLQKSKTKSLISIDTLKINLQNSKAKKSLLLIDTGFASLRSALR